jgi:hypothetical protein
MNDRKILLPTRKKLLEDIEVELSDIEILNMDEKQFAEYYEFSASEYKDILLARKEEEIQNAKREKELEEAKKIAAEEAKIEAERIAEENKLIAEQKAAEDLKRIEQEKIDAIEKIKQEQIEKDIKLGEEKMRLEREERDKKLAELEKEKKDQQNEKYKKWKIDNNFIDDNTFKIERIEGNKFIMWKKVSDIIIN